MSDPRLYRTALVPVLLALVLLAFSLENRPRRADDDASAPDAFTGDRAFDRAYGPGGLADRFPERRPGSAGDERLADVVARELEAAQRLSRCARSTREGETIDGRQTLRTVIAERAGHDRRAHRRRRPSRRRRQAGGGRAVGDRRAARARARVRRAAPDPAHADARLDERRQRRRRGRARRSPTRCADRTRACSCSATSRRATSACRCIAPWSDALGATPARLRATLQESLRADTGAGARQPRALSQFVRLRDAGDLRRAGRAARARPARGHARRSAATARPRRARRSPARACTQLGRAALRTVTALDAAPRGRPVSPQASTRDLVTSRKVLPGWAVRLFTGALLLAPFVVAIDALAAVLRARDPLLASLRWTLAAALPFAVAALFALALGATGLLAATPATPVAPRGAAASRRRRCSRSCSCSCSRGSGCGRSCCALTAHRRRPCRDPPAPASSCCCSRSRRRRSSGLRNPYAVRGAAARAAPVALRAGPGLAHEPACCASGSSRSRSYRSRSSTPRRRARSGSAGSRRPWTLLLLVAGGHVSLLSLAAVEPARRLRGHGARDRRRAAPCTTRAPTCRSPCAGRAPTPAPARSAAPNRRCGASGRARHRCERCRRC